MSNQPDNQRIYEKLDELSQGLTEIKTLLVPPGGKSLPTRVEELERFQWRATGVLGVAMVGVEGLWHWLKHKP